MRTKMLFLATLVAVISFAQDYVLVREAALTATADAVTVQQPATDAARVVRFIGAYVYCSVDCAVTLERNGTAASATSATPAPVSSSAPAAKTTAFVASNAGAGTGLGKYTIPANGSLRVDLSALALFGPGTAKNVTVRVGSLTGTVKYILTWTEIP